MKPLKMAWNEPGVPGGPSGQNPWGSGGGKGQEPPDLDEIMQNLQKRLNKLFGDKGNSKNNTNNNGGDNNSGGGSSLGFSAVIGVAVVVWLLSGIYIIDPPQRGVVLQFGKFVEIVEPGPHWHIPYPFEHVEKVNVDRIRNAEIGYRSGSFGRAAGTVPRESQMLTQDENIIDIKFAVQYRVADAQAYLFNVNDPHTSLRQATESAVREIIGKSKMDFVLTSGRNEIAAQAKTLIQGVLTMYGTGLEITSVNMQDAQPPEQVQEAFADVVKAREDRQKRINQAEAYANDIIPKARGKAARMIEEANAYKSQVISKADGEANRFEQILVEYKKAKEVTRKRLYMDTMENVLNKSNKVLVDVKQGNNMFYLPLDKLMQSGAMIAEQKRGEEEQVINNIGRIIERKIPTQIREGRRSRGVQQ